MKRLGRWLLNALTVLSLLLCLATGWFWWRVGASSPSGYAYHFGYAVITITPDRLLPPERVVGTAWGVFIVSEYHSIALGRITFDGPSAWMAWRASPARFGWHASGRFNRLVSEPDVRVPGRGFTWRGFAGAWGDKQMYGMSRWFFAAPFWAWAGALVALPGWRAVDAIRRRQRRSDARGGPRCTTCEYDLTGNLSGVCPECGTKVAPQLCGGRG